jgi:hypothetical protein
LGVEMIETTAFATSLASKPGGGNSMTKQKHATAALMGLLFAGGTIVTAGTATAAVSTAQSLATAPSAMVSTVSNTTTRNRPRCHWVHGHWRYRRGHRIWVSGHRVCYRR